MKLTQEQIDDHAKKVKKQVEQYDKDGVLIKIWDSGKEAGLSLNINAGNIAECCTGKRKTAGGYIWKHHLEEVA